MKKIRINELARELEVKAHEILDRLPELGVTEKKTHSSSIDEDVAIKLRRLYGFDVPDLEPEAAIEGEPVAPEAAAPAAEPKAPAARPPAPAERPAAPAGSAPAEEPARPSPSIMPIRPPLSTGKPIHPPLGGAGTRPATVPSQPSAP